MIVLQQARLAQLLNSLQRRYSLRLFLGSGVSRLALATGMAWHDIETIEDDDGQ